MARDLAAMDWRVGQPKRLSILVALEHRGALTFSELGDVTGVSAGNLSSHLGRLQGWGLVTIGRRLAVGQRNRTTADITRAGVEALEGFFEDWAGAAAMLAAMVATGSGDRAR